MIKYNSKSDQIRCDYRLLAIVLCTKWKMILAATLIGALMSGIIYYMNEAEAINLMQYQSTSTFYVEYEVKENGEIYYAYNEQGWSYVVMFDEIVDLALEQLPFEMSKEEIYEIVSSENGADYKILTVTATAENPDVCKPILEAFIPAMEAYGQSSKHIAFIESAMEPTTPKLLVVPNEITRAIMAGLCVGFILGVLGVGLFIVIQDVFYVETTLQATYAIPVVDAKERVEGRTIEVVAGKTTHGTIVREIESAKLQGDEIAGMHLVQCNPWIEKMYYR